MLSGATQTKRTCVAWESSVTELLVVNSALADKLLKAGIALVEQGRIVDGNRCFVFQYGPGQSATVRKIVYGR